MQPRVDPNSLAIDSNALNGLKHSAQNDSPESIRAAAKQFEAVLMNMMLKSMRDTVPQDGMTDSEQSKMFMGMLDQQLSTHLSQKGLGLADVLTKQLTKISPSAMQADKTTSAQKPGKTDLSASLTAQPVASGKALLAQAIQKIREAYQQWDASEPVPTDSNHTRMLEIPELPTLLDEAETNIQNFTLPQAPIASTLREVAGKTQQFIQSMLPHAQAASSTSGIPAKFMLGQAALESGWGKHEVRSADGRNSHNLFGIKADASWKGKTINSITTEYTNGVKQSRVEKFRAYDSYADAFKDYAKLISQNPRYEQAMHNTHDASAYAHALQQAGYATDPQYGRKLTQVIKNLKG